MEDIDKVGELAHLPDGELVRIEAIYRDRIARVRRIEGEFAGSIILCRLDQLEIVKEASE